MTKYDHTNNSMSVHAQSNRTYDLGAGSLMVRYTLQTRRNKNKFSAVSYLIAYGVRPDLIEYELERDDQFNTNCDTANAFELLEFWKKQHWRLIYNKVSTEEETCTLEYTQQQCIGIFKVLNSDPLLKPFSKPIQGYLLHLMLRIQQIAQSSLAQPSMNTSITLKSTPALLTMMVGLQEYQSLCQHFVYDHRFVALAPALELIQLYLMGPTYGTPFQHGAALSNTVPNLT